ncbi:transposase [Burkholderia ubonensis]|uniref:transposase n=1 Tax=Burkholderia ubonensis TaxID=101571 RepID=UPI002ABDD99F|nr:transposase [Burkholderia ubonensis]
MNPPELYRQYGISDAIYDRWKATFGRMTFFEAQHLKELGQENNKLKRLLAESIPGNAALKDLLAALTTKR